MLDNVHMSENAGQLILDERSFDIFNAALENKHGVAVHDLATEQRQFAVQALSTGLTALANQPDRVVSSMHLNGEPVQRNKFTESGFRDLLQTALSHFAFGALCGHEISICVTDSQNSAEQQKIVVISAA
jgi:hypothetical protein